MKENVDLTENGQFSTYRPPEQRFLREVSFWNELPFEIAMKVRKWTHKCLLKPNKFMKSIGIGIFDLIGEGEYHRDIQIPPTHRCPCCGKNIVPWTEFCPRCNSFHGYYSRIYNENSWPYEMHDREMQSDLSVFYM